MATNRSVRSSGSTPLSPRPASASTSRPAVIAPSLENVTVNDFRIEAARSRRSVQRTFGAIWSRARRTWDAILGAKAEFFSISHSTVAQSRPSAFSRSTSSNTVLPTPRRPVTIMDCSA